MKQHTLYLLYLTVGALCFATSVHAAAITTSPIKAIGLSKPQVSYHTCVILENEKLKCFGLNNYGQLGYGDSINRGNTLYSMGDNLSYVDLGTGRAVKKVSTGYRSTCAILDNGQLKCWGFLYGYGYVGRQLNQMGDNLTAINLGTGRTAVDVEKSYYGGCALLDNGDVKCWGYNYYGSLGQGDTIQRYYGSTYLGDNLTAIDLGTNRYATKISHTRFSNCAILDNGQVKCWGYNYYGGLGQGDTQHRGDNPYEMGDNLTAVDLGTGRTALDITMGYQWVCALLDNYQVKCWGYGGYGTLGKGSSQNIGNYPYQMGDNLTAIDLGTGRTAKHIYGGYASVCAILDNDELKCWGYNYRANLGTGDRIYRGTAPNQMGDNLTSIDLGTGEVAAKMSAGYGSPCAILSGGSVKCWGYTGYGGTGHGNYTSNYYISDVPYEMGDNLTTVDLGMIEQLPTAGPTGAPSASPSFSPSFDPTSAPSFSPSFAPTSVPSFSPSFAPTITPTTGCFECPPYSKKFFDAKYCASNFNDCKCDDGYKRDENLQTCVYCNTYTCPENAVPLKNECCIDSFAKCKCKYGFERQLDKCISCKTYQCPENSTEKKRRCIRSFQHCKCNNGYIKYNESCIPNN